MATVKADAHFVDCDRATGDGGSWQVDQYGVPSWVGAISNEGSCTFFDEDFLLTSNSPSTGSGAHGCDVGPKGYVAFGNTVTSGTDDAIYLFDYAGNQITDRSFQMGASYISTRTVPFYLRFSNDGDYVYCIYVNLSTYGGGRLYKFNVATGALEWLAPLYIDNYSRFNVDENEDIHVIQNGYAPTYIPWFTTLDPTTGTSKGTISANDIVPGVGIGSTTLYDIDYDVETGNTYTCTNSFGTTTPVFHTVWSSSGDTYWGGEGNVQKLLLFGDYLYCLSINTNNNKIYKLDKTDLSLSESVSITSGTAVDISLKSDSRIVVAANDSTDKVYEYDLDLSLKNTYTAPSVSPTGETRQVFQAYPSPWVASGSQASIVLSTQYRAVAYPTDWAHLEGQTVQVLKDGNYIGDDVVTGGQITLDD